jgi:hypothetical protein
METSPDIVCAWCGVIGHTMKRSCRDFSEKIPAKGCTLEYVCVTVQDTNVTESTGPRMNNHRGITTKLVSVPSAIDQPWETLTGATA